MKPIINIKQKVLVALLTIAALLTGHQTAMAQSQVYATKSVTVSILGIYSSSSKNGRYFIGSNIMSGRYEYLNLNSSIQTIPSASYNLGNNDFPLSMTVTNGTITLAEGTSDTDVTTTNDNFTLTFTSSKYITAAVVTKDDGTAVEGCTVSGTYSKSVTVMIPKKTFGKVTLTMATHTPLNVAATISGIKDTYLDDGVNHPVPTVTYQEGSSSAIQLTALGTTALQSGSTIYSGYGQTLTLAYSGGSETFTMPAMDIIPLLNGYDNTDVIAANQSSGKNVILTGRTLYKDDSWNTLCLPFNVTIAGSVLAGATLMELDKTGIYDGHQTGVVGDILYLYFKTATSIEAGKPYLIKWASGDPIANPEFKGVTLSSTAPTDVEFTGGSFVGQYSPFGITSENVGKIIYLGSGNNIGYAKENQTLKCFRAHFEILGANSIKGYQIGFGEGETTGIVPIKAVHEAQGIYTLDGLRIEGRPTRKGIYIKDRKKVIINN